MNSHTLNVTGTDAFCPSGEAVGQQNLERGAIPVMSCEGACIRGEIARQAANRVAKLPGYARACHGELFAVPDSAMARWVKQAGEVVIIDGCHLRCHGRIVENLVGTERVRGFNALAHYRKYSEFFEVDAVPEAERRTVAEDVATWVAHELAKPAGAPTSPASSCGCCAG